MSAEFNDSELYEGAAQSRPPKPANENTPLTQITTVERPRGNVLYETSRWSSPN